MAFIGIFAMLGVFIFIYFALLFMAIVSLVVGIILGKKTRFKKTGLLLRILGYLVIIPDLIFFLYAQFAH